MTLILGQDNISFIALNIGCIYIYKFGNSNKNNDVILKKNIIKTID